MAVRHSRLGRVTGPIDGLLPPDSPLPGSRTDTLGAQPPAVLYACNYSGSLGSSGGPAVSSSRGRPLVRQITPESCPILVRLTREINSGDTLPPEFTTVRGFRGAARGTDLINGSNHRYRQTLMSGSGRIELVD